MYLTSLQPNIMGPGTGLVQRYDWSPAQSKRMEGMGCGCAGLKGCPCDKSGGLGLFDSGLDFTGWGLPEFGVVGLGAYMLLSVLSTTKRAARRVSSTVSGAYKGARRANPGRRRRARR
jgi:hypothetical protein